VTSRTLAAGAGALLAAATLLAGVARAEVEPDRPDTTNSVQTVPPGAAQLETGLEYARTRVAAEPVERRFAVQAALRAGLTDRLELRLEGEPLVRLRGVEDDTNHGDLTVGVKYRFLETAPGKWWPALGVNPFVKIPLADEPIGTERVDFGLLALAGLDLPWKLSLDVNAGLTVVGQSRPNGHLPQALTSASLSAELVEDLAPFVEVALASREERDGRDTLRLASGLVYRVTSAVAIDAAVETGLVGRTPDYAVRAGVTVRFGR